MKVIIELELSKEPNPDIDIGVSDLMDETIKEAVYSYLIELIDDDSLTFTVEK